MAQTQVRPESRLKPAGDIVARKIAGEMILVPIRRSAIDIGSIYTLNDTGARVWSLLDGQRTLAQIRDAIVEEHEVEPDQAWADLVALATDLLRAGAVLED